MCSTRARAAPTTTRHANSFHSACLLLWSCVCVIPPRQVNIPRGSTVAQFLDRARMEIQKDFKELRNAPVENLLYARLPAPFHDTLKLFCYILAAIIHSYFATSSRPRVVASGSCAVNKRQVHQRGPHPASRHHIPLADRDKSAREERPFVRASASCSVVVACNTARMYVHEAVQDVR